MTKSSEETTEITVTTLQIATVEEFLEFAENCRLDVYSQNLSVSLEKDIDLSGYEFTGVPIFNGIFDGKNHKISGLAINGDGSTQGLFRYLTADAIIQNYSIHVKTRQSLRQRHGRKLLFHPQDRMYLSSQTKVSS